MQLIAILEFKVADRFIYNTSNTPLNNKGYIPIFETPEPIEKIDAFVKMIEAKYADYLYYDALQIKKYWKSFNQGWRIGQLLSVA